MTRDVAPGSGRWGDLGPRVLSALVLAAAAILAIWQGGLIFAVFVSAVVGVIAW